MDGVRGVKDKINHKYKNLTTDQKMKSGKKPPPSPTPSLKLKQ